MAFCRECGRNIPASVILCPNCGAQQVVLSQKNKVIAALLAFFLGGLGIHKFYLDRPIQGLFYILFCWTFIPTIIAFIEGVIYLFTSDREFARKYG